MSTGNGLAAVRLQTGRQPEQLFYLTKPITSIGRDQYSDIVVADHAVSYKHALIKREGAQWRIQKAKPDVTLTVNQKPVDETVIEFNDHISLGPYTQLLFIDPTDTVKAPDPATAHRRKMPFLEVSISSWPGREVHPLDKPLINIGRDSSNDIVIPSPIVSSWHAQVQRRNNQCILIHPQRQGGTRNGLRYEGHYIPGNASFRHTLMHGDVFRIGREDGALVTITYNDGSGAPRIILPEVKPIEIKAATITIGRLPDNMVVLDHPQVSAHHARLERVARDEYHIIDQGSTNHVYVNGRRITQHVLKRDDKIWIGPFELIYTGTQLTQYDESKSFRIDAMELNKRVIVKVKKEKVPPNIISLLWYLCYGLFHPPKEEKVLLNNISLSIQPHQFVALVGGSGAGKSTLMDALNGLRPAKGEVFYNGKDFYNNRTAFSTLIGYVPQQDIVHSDLSVERALYYTARMRLPSDDTNEQIQQRIEDVLKAVDMTHTRTLMVKELSGGQRKRVSIALELLAQPSIFFLDEPTSGLDPGLDLKMMHLLRDLADEGRTVVLVTHATNNIFFCDRVCFLARGGRLAYYGPPHQAKIFFEKEDFAEIYTELEPTDNDPGKAERAEQRFKIGGERDKGKGSEDYRKYVEAPLQARPSSSGTQQQKGSEKREKRGNPWLQFLLLTQRYLELLKNDKVNRWILLLQAPVIGIILMAFISFGIGSVGGSGGFDPNIIIQCPVTSQKLVNNQPALVPREQAASTDCKSVQDYLEHNTSGKAYAKHQGGVQKALQDFIVPGPGDAPKILFIIAFAAIMFGSINGTREIVKELHVYRRERAVNLGILPYMFSKIVVLGALSLIQSAILVGSVYVVDPFGHSIFLAPWLEIYITTALTSIAGLMVGLFVSAIFSNSDRAVNIIPAILLPQVIFSGLLFPLTNLFMQVPGLLFPIRWAMAGLGSTVGLHSDKLEKDALLGNDYTYHSTLFSTYSRDDAIQHLLFIWCILGAFSVLLACFIGIALKLKDRQKDVRA